MKSYEKPLGEKIMEVVILTIVATGTFFMIYGLYEIVDMVFIRKAITC